MAGLKKLSIGVQSFSKLIEEDFIYVDKTEFIYKLIKRGSYYFLSRPRRFGKSLLISTIKELYSGNRKLFESSFIGQSDYEWPEHPIIHLDFSALSSKTGNQLEHDLLRNLERIAHHYGIDVSKDTSLPLRAVALVQGLASKKNRVVILVDEYDYPLLNNIENLKLAEECRDVLREFFTALKNLDDYIELIFITGITKFSKTSIFSGLNNLKDLTLDPRAAKLLGYTAHEIIASFKPYLEEVAQSTDQDLEEIMEGIRYWYNGYQFTEATAQTPEESVKVYNPFSVLLFLNDGKFLNYWFESGTPTFLIHLIKNQNYPVFSIEGAEVNVEETKSYDLDQIQLLPLLWQAGYLTIEDYNPQTRNYKLGFPNAEVRTSFLTHLMRSFTGNNIATIANYAAQLKNMLNRGNYDDFLKLLQVYFANIPFSLQLAHEKYYQTIFYIILTLVGIKTDAEDETNDGRIDGVVETNNHIVIFEFKLNESAGIAMKQIEDKKYYQKFLNKKKNIVLIGANFDEEKRNIVEWIIKEIPPFLS